ncbi:MAG: OmpW/AlkL family protein, partial [Janthinobacterium lividum]
MTIAPNVTVVTELGYRRGDFGVSLTGGLPPRATVEGAGSLASLGTLGRIRYGPMVLTAHYHYPSRGRFQPYVGAGPVLLLIFKNRDGAVTGLDVKDHWGFCLQLGAELEVTRRWSIFIDSKKAALKADATALLQGTPIQA